MSSKEMKVRDSPEDRPVTEQDFTSGAVTKAVLEKITNSRSVVYSAAAGGCLAAFGATVGPPIVIAAGIAGLALGAGSWVIQYFFLGEKMAEKHVAKLKAKRQEQQRAELSKLADECDNADFSAGAKEAREIDAAFRKLESVVNERGPTDSSGTLFLFHAEDALKAAVGKIRQAFELRKALQSIDEAAHKREIAEWSRNVKKRELLGEDVSALKRNIETHQKTLASCRERQKVLESLLAESNDIESALVSAQLELSALSRGNSVPLELENSAARGLQNAVAAARRTEERLRGLGSLPHSDQEYLTKENRQ